MANDDSGFPEIEEYAKKLNHNPESLVFVPLAEAYRKSGMLTEAIDACQKGLKLHPTYMSARMVLGRAFMEKDMLDEASAEFRKVSSADVNNIMAHSLLAQISMKQQQYADAIKEYQKVLTLNPDDSTAQEMLNKALELTRQSNTTKQETPVVNKKAGESDKKQNLNKAEELSKQGDIDNAIKIYQLILEADPENLVVRQRLKDLELQKAQADVGGRSTASKTRPEPEDGYRDYRDNDKITSDDILSVMKDTSPKASFSAASKPNPQSAAPKPAVSKPNPQPAAPKPVVPKAVPQSAAPKPVAPKVADAREKIPVLDKLLETEGILGCMLLDLEGKIRSSVFNNLPKDENEIAKAVSLIFGKTEKSVQAMDYGKQVNQILITGEKGQIIFSKVGSSILLVLADENINLGKMRLAMNDVVRVLRQ